MLLPPPPKRQVCSTHPAHLTTFTKPHPGSPLHSCSVAGPPYNEVFSVKSVPQSGLSWQRVTKAASCVITRDSSGAQRDREKLFSHLTIPRQQTFFVQLFPVGWLKAENLLGSGCVFQFKSPPLPDSPQINLRMDACPTGVGDRDLGDKHTYFSGTIEAASKLSCNLTKTPGKYLNAWPCCTLNECRFRTQGLAASHTHLLV